ncbi:MAG: hypothetical protein K9N55_02480 [Phycisphaerae bacterium]|nr:hypothetical protein [Phycisphaerae bacterium]
MSERLDAGPDGVDVTDSLEATFVFRAWKNLFFFILILCMLLIQGIFWVTDLGLVTPPDPNGVQAALPLGSEPAVVSTSESAPGNTLYGIAPGHLDLALGLINSVTFLAAVLYCLTLMFSMMISIISRLGGIRHVCRAFFLSMIVLVFLIPWHAFLESSVLGVLFSHEDLVQSMAAKQASLHVTILYYARFCGYWVVVMLMLFVSQARLGRWSRAMQRRLEIV